MTTNGTNPFIAAQIARYRADELVREARLSRESRRARRERRTARRR